MTQVESNWVFYFDCHQEGSSKREKKISENIYY